MDSNTILATLMAPRQPITLSVEQIAAFDEKINTCYNLLANDQHVSFAGGIHECIGPGAVGDFLAQQLSMLLHKPVVIFYNAQQDKTIIRFARNGEAGSSISKLQKHDKSVTLPVVNARKNPPRPMNCWLLYRDAMQKEFKAADPEMSVQDISKKSSATWKSMTAEEQAPWRKAANDAKQLHNARYPDYKYAPRKPGQKKKRQSRKAVQAAISAPAVTAETAIAVPAVTAEPEIIDFNSFMDSSPFDDTPEVCFDGAVHSITSIASEVSSSLDRAIGDYNAYYGVQQVDSSEDFHNLEFVRHEMLESQFNSDLSLEYFEDETQAFRTEANRNVSMLYFYTETY